MSDAWEVLKLLSDSTRVRLLFLLNREELSVAELQEVLAMGQSRISSHLALLRQAGLVQDRREGKKTFYSSTSDLPSVLASLRESALQSVAGTPEVAEDHLALERILAKRKEAATEYFNSVAGRLSKDYCPGRSWEGIGQFLLHLVPPLDVVDLGAGEGLISQLLARRARKVTCVDNSPRMVEVGTTLAERNGFANLSYVLGDIEHVPLPDASADLAILSQALHHADHPQTAAKEAARILRPGGRLVILDLLEHSFEEARELYADRWLGFSENTLFALLKSAGLSQIETAVVSREIDPPHFQTVFATDVRL